MFTIHIILIIYAKFLPLYCPHTSCSTRESPSLMNHHLSNSRLLTFIYSHIHFVGPSFLY